VFRSQLCWACCRRGAGCWTGPGGRCQQGLLGPCLSGHCCPLACLSAERVRPSWLAAFLHHAKDRAGGSVITQHDSWQLWCMLQEALQKTLMRRNILEYGARHGIGQHRSPSAGSHRGIWVTQFCVQHRQDCPMTHQIAPRQLSACSCTAVWVCAHGVDRPVKLPSSRWTVFRDARVLQAAGSVPRSPRLLLRSLQPLRTSRKEKSSKISKSTTSACCLCAAVICADASILQPWLVHGARPLLFCLHPA
jgi:hypothetical protein